MSRKILDISEEPWISPKARHWLNSFLKPQMVVFEYGSGGSTLFFARRVKKIISVEFQLLWYLGVLWALLRRGIFNFKLHLSLPERGNEIDKKFMSSDSSIKSLSFKKFVTTINKYPNRYFDLVFIDGRARNQCVAYALSKVKKGGRIMLDDSKRSIYSPGKKLLRKYPIKRLGQAFVWQII